MQIQESVFGLCEGRHEIKDVSTYIFPNNFFQNSTDIFNFSRMQNQIHSILKNQSAIKLYVTGFTPALIEVINYCNFNSIKLILMHFDRDTQSYLPQTIYQTIHA